MRLVAIDTGITGAIAVLETGKLYLYDMPVLTARNGKNRVDAQALGRIVAGCDEVAIEEVSAMSGQGLSSTFGFGFSAGVCAGVCGAFESENGHFALAREALHFYCRSARLPISDEIQAGERIKLARSRGESAYTGLQKALFELGWMG